jgi:hypothetical protein
MRSIDHTPDSMSRPSGRDTAVLAPHPCAGWCTNPEHREPGWDSLSAFGKNDYEALHWCRATLATVEDSSVEHACPGWCTSPVSITVGLEQLQSINSSIQSAAVVHPARVTVEFDGDTASSAGLGYDEVSPMAARRLAALLNVAADRLEHRPSVVTS